MPPIEKYSKKEVGEEVARQREGLRREDLVIDSIQPQICGVLSYAESAGVLVETMGNLFNKNVDKVTLGDVIKEITKFQDVRDFNQSLVGRDREEEITEAIFMEYLKSLGITNISLGEDLDFNEVGLIAIPKEISGSDLSPQVVLKALADEIGDDYDGLYETMNTNYLKELIQEGGEDLSSIIEIVMKRISPDKIHQEKITMFVHREKGGKVYIVSIVPFGLAENTSIFKQYLEHPNWIDVG